MREWLLEEVDGAEASGLSTMRCEVNGGEDNRTRLRVARAQIVEKLLAQVVDPVDVENKEIRALVEDHALRLLKTTGEIGMRSRRGFA